MTDLINSRRVGALVTSRLKPRPTKPTVNLLPATAVACRFEKSRGAAAVSDEIAGRDRTGVRPNRHCSVSSFAASRFSSVLPVLEASTTVSSACHGRDGKGLQFAHRILAYGACD